MTAILGVSAYYHDSAAALVVDGEIAAAAQEERFSRKRHDAAFPTQAIDFCLSQGGISAEDLDFVVFYEKPLLKFERILETALAVAPRGLSMFWEALPAWLHEKLHLPREMRRALGGRYKRRFLFVQHHEAHAASAFFPSPFDEAAILTIDGVGEWATTLLAHGTGERIEPLEQMKFPHSLGLLYSAFTGYCGFKVNSGEYKLMGLAPYGEPRFADLIRREFLDVRPDGSFRLNMQNLDYCHRLRMFGPRLEQLMGTPARLPEAPLTQHTMDVAASIQEVLEERVLALAERAYELTRCRNLCLAGGVALNCVATGRVLRDGPFERIWTQPAAGDAGGALGAALFVDHQLRGRRREFAPAPNVVDRMAGSLLGPEFRADEILRAIEAAGIVADAVRYDTHDTLCGAVAKLLDSGQIVGWFQGRMEFGPRALGARSILADARNPAMQQQLNLKTKFRESFRPFAPAVLEEEAQRWFDLPKNSVSPYMLLTVPVHEDQRLQVDAAVVSDVLSDRLRQVRSTIPAVTHVNMSARIQTVSAARHPLFHSLLRAFFNRTGCPVLVNTSFNVRGEPIVCSPAEAIRCFQATAIDALAIGPFLVIKSRQMSEQERSAYLTQFSAD